MSIDPDFTLRKGDVVSCQGTLFYNHNEGDTIAVELAPGDKVYIARQHLTLVRTVVAAGDSVTSRSGGRVGTVRAVHRDRAWVDWGTGDHIEKIDDLERGPTLEDLIGRPVPVPPAPVLTDTEEMPNIEPAPTPAPADDEMVF